MLHVDAKALAADPEPEHCELGDGTAVSVETARRLACDAPLVEVSEGPDGAPIVGRRTRTIPAALRRALRLRDGGCRFPGCTNRIFVDAHHIEHWADGGETTLENLVELCRRHHRLVHEEKLFRVERLEDGGVAFYDRRGCRLEPVPPRPEAPEDGVGALADRHRREGLEIGPETAFPAWDGEPMDHALAVDALVGASSAATRCLAQETCYGLVPTDPTSRGDAGDALT